MMIQKCTPTTTIAYTAGEAQTAKAVRRFSQVPKSEKRYMQSADFLNDPHNRKMFDIIDKMMLSRDKVLRETKALKNNSVYAVHQGVDGYTKISQNVRRNKLLDFSHKPQVKTDGNMELFSLEQQMKAEVAAEKQKFGLADKIAEARNTRKK